MNKTRIIAFLLFVGILCAALAACGDNGGGQTAQTAVIGFFEGLKANDIASAFKNVDYSDEEIAAEVADFNATIVRMSEQGLGEVPKRTYEKLAYKVLSETINGDTATVKVEVSMPDFEAIATKIISSEEYMSLMAESQSGDAETLAKLKETIAKRLAESLSDANVELATKQIDIEVTSDEASGAWKIQADEVKEGTVLYQILSGGVSK